MSNDTIATNRALVRRELEEGWNADDLDVLDELYADDVRPPPSPVRGELR